ncbi:protein NCBP2AS2 [Trichomycterus rosablanca]|uniref:protein NCBP2AS2 n=1 Tax=Trichomycterus rosablanca TaxID=2290929 RepID=UPI002F350C5B
MVLQKLLYTLINNAQLVEKLAESRPIRRAAQITASVITRAQIAGQDASTKLLKSDTVRQIREETAKVPGSARDAGQRAARVRDTFIREIKEHSRHIKDKK